MPPSLSVEQVVEKHAPMVRRLALRMASQLPTCVDINDLIQSGMIGLIDAAKRYKPVSGSSFETYAYTRINGAIVDELRAMDWLPRTVRKKAKVLESAINSMEKTLCRTPTEEELAEHMGMTADQFTQTVQDAQGAQLVYIDDLQRIDASQDSLNFEIASPEGQIEIGNPLNQALSKDLAKAIARGIEQLPEREKMVLHLNYIEDMNQKEISLTMDLSESRISQLRTIAISRLRSYLSEHGWAEHDLTAEAGVLGAMN